jgi:hypothetical protein
MRKAIIAASMIAALSSGTAKADAITKQAAIGCASRQGMEAIFSAMDRGEAEATLTALLVYWDCHWFSAGVHFPVETKDFPITGLTAVIVTTSTGNQRVFFPTAILRFAVE